MDNIERTSERFKVDGLSKSKPTFKIRRINHNPSRVLTLKDLSDEINALQRSVAHLTYRLSKLDYLVSRQRESWY